MSGLVQVSQERGVARVFLNRPDVRNALSAALLKELREELAALAADESIRALVLGGAGKDFCAGADIHEMHALGAASLAENVADAEKLSATFRAVRDFPRPVIARVQGNVFGGGAGLVAASDIAVIAKGARFAFSEVRLGILPAVISPFVVRRIGEGLSRRLFLTGERFNGEDAVRFGLGSIAVNAADLEEAVNGVTNDVLLGSPDAQRRTKLLLDAVGSSTLDEATSRSPQFIADARASEEGQEGLRAFQEKRKPRWQSE